MLLGGIEAGGTKVICGVAEMERGEVRLLDQVKFPTTTAAEVIPAAISYFQKYPIETLGIASFGPIDLHKNSPTYGYIQSTPKEGWQNVDFVHPFAAALSIPVAFDTDVNGAALGEAIYGAGKGCDVVTYMTVGTGIGVGTYVEGHLLHGLVHPEAGHMQLVRHPKDTYQGHCPFHPHCLEGLACGPAIEARWGEKGEKLRDRKDVWDMEAFYLAQGVTNLILCYSPEKIILGGGVMHQKDLFPRIWKQVQQNLNGYIRSDKIEKEINQYIVPLALGDQAGLIGALELGRRIVVTGDSAGDKLHVKRLIKRL